MNDAVQHVGVFAPGGAVGVDFQWYEYQQSLGAGGDPYSYGPSPNMAMLTVKPELRHRKIYGSVFLHPNATAQYFSWIAELAFFYGGTRIGAVPWQVQSDLNDVAPIDGSHPSTTSALVATTNSAEMDTLGVNLTHPTSWQSPSFLVKPFNLMMTCDMVALNLIQAERVSEFRFYLAILSCEP